MSVLLSTVDDAAVAALRGAGLSMESVVRSAGVVVGVVAPQRLADVAMVDAVRRIMPARARNHR